MANQIAIRQMLIRLRFSAEAATFIMTEQGLDTLDDIAQLTDDEIEKTCKLTRKPGGMIDNPAAAVVPAAGVAGANDQAPAPPAQIPNPGHKVTNMAESNLQLAAFLLRYKLRTSRVLNPGDVTLEAIREIKHLRESEKAHKDSEAPDIIEKNWPRTIEALERWLKGRLGVTKIPLAYVIRENEAPMAGNPSDFLTYQHEMIARAPIRDPNGEFNRTFLTDRIRVFDLLAELTQHRPCWAYVRTGERNSDGRAAFLALKAHYLGNDRVQSIAAQAESAIETARYLGEKRNFTFETYTQIHKENHHILDSLVADGYSGMDVGTKIRKFMHGIRDPKLDSVKNSMDAQKPADFDECERRFREAITREAVRTKETRTVTIAGVKTKGRTVASTNTSSGDWNEGLSPDMSIELRYYKKNEYKGLTAAQKYGLKLKREKYEKNNPGKPLPGAPSGRSKSTPHKSGKSSKNAKHGSRETTYDLKRAIAVLQSKVDAAGSDYDSDDSSDATPKQSNSGKTTKRHSF